MRKNGCLVLELLFAAGIVLLSIGVLVFRDWFTDRTEIGYLGLFVLCCLANATVLVPAPSLALAASCATVLNPWLVAVVAALGSTLGEGTGYLLGKTGRDISPRFRTLADRIAAKQLRPTTAIFVLALLPLPLFDIVGIYSGGIHLGAVPFFTACFLGKLLKMLLYTRSFQILGWLLSLRG